ncbi:hypothetical protein N0V90_008704 [Kalmusia sp. IMI 367209]|nr:hypothetical protein N0V90_008704 [Kalmusia sp. IMI 367209]
MPDGIISPSAPPPTQNAPSILLVGATGYVGGTVLAHLLTSPHPLLQTASISVLVRGAASRIALLERTYAPRLHGIPFTDLDDAPLIERLSAQHDVVVNAASGFHVASALAMVRGLAARRARTGREVYMVHTSGCSNIADRPLTGSTLPLQEWDDAAPEEVFAFLRAQNEREWYVQRACEIGVLEASEDAGVKAVSIQAPCIYGAGKGLFRRVGVVLPVMMDFVLSRGYGFVVGDGTGDYDIVHVSDLADLYARVLLNMLSLGGKDLGTGRRGVVFASTGRVLVRDIAQGCVDAAFAAGALPLEGGPREKEVRVVELAEAATTVAGTWALRRQGGRGIRRRGRRWGRGSVEAGAR